MKGRIPLAEAQRVARKWLDVFKDDCLRIEVAGSIRRKREEVGDIEIVAIPKPSEPKHLALLPGAPAADENNSPLFERIHDLSTSRNGPPPIAVTKGLPGLQNGKARYIQLFDKKEDLYVDLFLAKPETWGVIFTIRTGSADFSHGLMIRANQLGMTSHKGRLCFRQTRTLAVPLPTPEERDVFKALRIRWVEPPLRHDVRDVMPSPS